MSASLDGPLGKIDRADEHITNLEAEIAAYFAPRSDHVIKAVAYPERNEAAVGLHAPEVPLRFGILIGEVVHHLRSSLDHLIWQLVIANNGTPTRQHEFPIYSDRDVYEKEARRKLRGVSEAARHLIRSYQPFQNASAKTSPLWHVQEIDNTDKHRVVIATASQAEYDSSFFRALFAESHTPPPHVIDPKRHETDKGYPRLSLILKDHGGTQPVIPYLQHLVRYTRLVVDSVGDELRGSLEAHASV